jgi:hypothetical protein
MALGFRLETARQLLPDQQVSVSRAMNETTGHSDADPGRCTSESVVRSCPPPTGEGYSVSDRITDGSKEGTMALLAAKLRT